MNRIPEPELMNGQEQALAYASADFSAGDQALIDRVQALFPAGLGECIADLGCGPGNISFRLARHFSDADVVGYDGASVMLALKLHDGCLGCKCLSAIPPPALRAVAASTANMEAAVPR